MVIIEKKQEAFSNLLVATFPERVLIFDIANVNLCFRFLEEGKCEGHAKVSIKSKKFNS